MFLLRVSELRGKLVDCFPNSSKHCFHPTASRDRRRIVVPRLRRDIRPVRTLTILAILIPPALLVYAYAVYPALLRLLARRTSPSKRQQISADLPFVTLTLPVYNEESSIAGAIESLLALNYPPERREIVVVSDASTDATDSIVERYADRGVQLLRLPNRGGKTAAENFAATRITGDIVVCTDATIRIPPEALKPLVRAFEDPSVGVASGRDVSVDISGDNRNASEASYVSYEMGVRSLETVVDSIVGASGCFFAIRRQLHESPFPASLSRDFASCLIARENGFRSVLVNKAVCYVPVTCSLAEEYRRKIRTMTRGIATLWFKRSLLNPLRYGRFSWMLISHKLVRWLIPLSVPLTFVILIITAFSGDQLAEELVVVLLTLLLVGGLSSWWTFRGSPPRPVASIGWAVAAQLAGLVAWLRFARGRQTGVWEPTRRIRNRTVARNESEA